MKPFHMLAAIAAVAISASPSIAAQVTFDFGQFLNPSQEYDSRTYTESGISITATAGPGAGETTAQVSEATSRPPNTPLGEAVTPGFWRGLGVVSGPFGDSRAIENFEALFLTIPRDWMVSSVTVTRSGQEVSTFNGTINGNLIVSGDITLANDINTDGRMTFDVDLPATSPFYTFGTASTFAFQVNNLGGFLNAITLEGPDRVGAEVPLPAGGILLLSALGLGGCAARRRSRK